MPKGLTPVERAWLGHVKSVRCVLCVYLGFTQKGGTAAHHPREGVGLSQRGGHFTACALCREHHQGSTGIHGLGTRGFYRTYKLDEVDLIDMTVRAVFEKLRQGAAQCTL